MAGGYFFKTTPTNKNNGCDYKTSRSHPNRDFTINTSRKTRGD